MTDISAMKIANVIHDARRKHQDYKEARMVAVELACELGMDQRVAMRDQNAINWLDAYLAGSGCLPADRRKS